MSNKNKKNTIISVATLKVIAEGGVNIREFESFDAPIVGGIDYGGTFEASHVGDEWVTTTAGKKVRNRPYILELIEGDDNAKSIMERNATLNEAAEPETVEPVIETHTEIEEG